LDYIEDHPKGLFLDHRTLLVLNKFHQNEQSPPQNKENSNPTRIWKQIQKKTARSAISRLGEGISRLIPCISQLIYMINRLYQVLAEMCMSPCARPVFDLRNFIYLHDVF